MKSLVFYKQLNAMDCGPTCLRMIAKYHGRHFNTHTLRQMTGFGKKGVTLLGISDAAEKIGFEAEGVKITFDQLTQIQHPCVLHWDRNHFVVMKKITRKWVEIADPAKGIIRLSKKEFLYHWLSSQNSDHELIGIALLLNPTTLFYKHQNEKEQKASWKQVFSYLRVSRWHISQVYLSLILFSTIQLVFPFLTQSIVDVGIHENNLNFVLVVLLAQTMLMLSQTIIGFIRSRLLLRISNILNIQILSDFWIKLTRLPLSYFDIHQTGDTIQRINDQKQIQAFLTGTVLNTVFSIFNFLLYAIILVAYNINLFLIFVAGSIVYVMWVQLFLHLRRKINYETFHISAKENTATLQLIQGMQEIRLNNAEREKRWEWENIQVNIFNKNFKSLNYSQLQSAGGAFIIQLQGIIISFIVAKLVIESKLTLGSMLAIQYIIGQLNAPVQQWIGFIQGFQDAKISMERLNEIHQMDNEETEEEIYTENFSSDDIIIDNLTFSYPGNDNDTILDNISLTIPKNRVTAIVGTSGSGKTTLIKLLLKVYTQYDGKIKINIPDNAYPGGDAVDFSNIRPSYWRSICGAVLQDGFIFNDTISKNIAITENQIDKDRLDHSCRIANINDYVASLPNGYNTKLGADGTGVSQGQRQRILIARSVYKDPHYLFFDEATNSLDANNEKLIVENLSNFFKGKTVVIVAHRLSTVKNADKIVVLDKGKIVEEGTHAQLAAMNGKYYELVKNQLELGN